MLDALTLEDLLYLVIAILGKTNAHRLITRLPPRPQPSPIPPQHQRTHKPNRNRQNSQQTIAPTVP